MILGQDVTQVLSMLASPNNPILLAFLAVGLACVLDLVPDGER